MKCSMQIDVPHSEYGECDWFMPTVLSDWLHERNLQSGYCAVISGGNGYTYGVTNKESVYKVEGIEKEDALIFKIMFSKCKVHVFER
jgi:hypothetical protein